MDTNNKRTLSTVLLSMSMLIMLLSIGMMLMSISAAKKSSVIPISMLPVGMSLWVVGTAMRGKAGG